MWDIMPVSVVIGCSYCRAKVDAKPLTSHDSRDVTTKAHAYITDGVLRI